MRYSQDQNFNIKGPGLPEQGVCAVGPAELEAAFKAGKSAWRKCRDCGLEEGVSYLTGWRRIYNPDETKNGEWSDDPKSVK